ncbi:PREDICTED: geranylgeranyl transferase type-2 subunit alpha-like isoform X2 [Vollenhovia emeryi]|uniref:geranylgeranyl transferase type-2 subunit alpha-like isoform X2 n=1 Tax=Vollenhovia emeryi TaxID=411798 RepID=UPI0005F45F4B|nr:PREDICTED: geranylgeranyl transferase type-2 subunit alpha-like isoform X2 [Vollenhovia emeryi]
MLGRVKVRTTAEQEEIKKQERAVKVSQYKADFTIRNILEVKKWGLELLNVTKRILLNNSDIYTLWNVRRQVFENKKWSEVEYKLMLENEMILTERCLRENPKSYSLWHQRCWVMERMPEPDWKKELSMCAKCLNLDERNFHCWDYREFVVQKAGISNEEELEFSTTKILSNFPNYSSWHYRSRILTKMFGTTSKEIPIVDDIYREELNLVMNATLTDPNDSAWFYQRWLLDESRTTCRLWRAEIEKDGAAVIIDNNGLIQPISLELFVNGEMVDYLSWYLYPDEEFAKLRIVEFDESLENLDHAKEVSVKLQETVYQLSYSELTSSWIYKDKSSLHKQNSNDKQLNEQLKCYNQLSKMEPNNKWALLTSVLLMKKIDFKKFYTDILDRLSALTKVDSLRKNYYKDLRSKFVVEYNLLEIWKKESDLEIQPKIDLSGLDLTKLHNNHYFSFFEEVKFGANQLKNSLYQLSILQRCVKLSLCSNGLTSLKHFPILYNLKVLILRDNMLTSTEEIVYLIEAHAKLRMLDLRNNPVCEKIDIAEIKRQHKIFIIV